MSSNLKVNTILPSSGNTVSIAGIASVTSSVSIASSCTATTFYGSGSNLTGVSGVSVANQTNNRLITATGTTDALNAESGLTWDGSTLLASGSDAQLRLYDSTASSENSAVRILAYNGVNFIQSGKAFSSDSKADLIFGSMFGGTEWARIDTSGRVLIGTTDPGGGNADELTVQNPAGGNTGITIRSGTSNTGNLFFSDATSGAAQYAGAIEFHHSDNSLNLNIGNTSKLKITSTGKFGLNRSAPQYAMHLSPATGETRIDLHMTNSTTGHNNNDGVQFGYQNTQGAYIWNFENTNIYFGTNNLERLRITSGGQVGLGRDSGGNINTRAVLELAAPFDDVSDNDGSADQGTNNHDAILLNIAGPAAASGKNIGSIAWDKGGRRRAAIMGEYQNTDNDYLALAFFTRGTDGTGDFYKSYIINHNGSASLHGSLSQNTSDDRLKKDKVEIENALDKVNSLSSFTHKWNEIAVRAGLEENKTEIGLSAQEVQGLYPSLVDVNNTMIDPDNPTTEYLTIHYEKVVPLLVASIKELTSEINSLKSRLSSLEGS